MLIIYIIGRLLDDTTFFNVRAELSIHPVRAFKAVLLEDNL